MKILLVCPVNKQIQQQEEIWPPLGLAYLATALRKEHSVEILDCPKEKMTHRQFADYIKMKNPDVVGFSFISVSLESTKKSASIVKQINPKITIIIGGPHVSGAPKETLEYLKEADFGFQGEADKGLPLLMDRISSGKIYNFSEIPGLIWRNNQDIILNAPYFIEDLDSLGFPSWDLIDFKGYPPSTFIHYLKSKREWRNAIYAPISITRGCSYNCTFCGCGAVSGKIFKKRSIPNIISEIKVLYDTYNIKMLMVVDDNLGFDKNFMQEFCNSLIGSGLKINWIVPLGLRLDNLDEETLRVMEKSGCCYFSVGIESGSQRILDAMNKNLSLKIIREKTSLVKRTTKIKIGGLFIIGYPSETKKEIKSTIRFAKDLELDLACFYLFAPSPGSKWYEYFKQNNRLDEINWNKLWGKGVSFNHDFISKEGLVRYYIFAYLCFYSRIKIIIDLHRNDHLFFLRNRGRIKRFFIDFLR